MQTSDHKICTPKSIQTEISVLLLVFSLSGCGQEYKAAMSRLAETEVVFPKQTVTKITRVPLIAGNLIDILWLVDNSPGATQIQSAFTEGVDSFAKKYLSKDASALSSKENLLNRDVRIAAIPTDLYLAGTSACVARDDLNNNGDAPGWSGNSTNAKVLCFGVTQNYSQPLEGKYVDQDQPNVLNWPPARQAATSWVGSDGNVYLFGGQGFVDRAPISGRNNFSILGDFWKWNGSQWTWINTLSGATYEFSSPFPTLPSPGIRKDSLVLSNPDGSFLLSGGQGWGPGLVTSTSNGLSVPSSLFDLILWNGTAWASYLSDSITPSILSTGAIFAESSDNTKMWAFGGSNSNLLMEGVWEVSGGVGGWKWTSREGGSGAGCTGTSFSGAWTVPLKRTGAIAWVDNVNNFYLLSGRSSQGTTSLCSDFWKWEKGSNRWTQLSLPPVSTRSFAAVWADNNGSVWIFGGKGNNSVGLNDLWKWNGMAWETISKPSNATTNNWPSARYGASSWKDSNGDLWLFGGADTKSTLPGEDYFNDLWKFNVLTNQWIRKYSTDKVYPLDYSRLKAGGGYHDGNRVFKGDKGRSGKAILTTKGPSSDLDRLSGDFKLNVMTGVDGSAPPSGFASLARFITDNEKNQCKDTLENCAFFRPNSKRVLIHVSNSFDFSQRNSVADAVNAVGTSNGQTSGPKFQKSYLDKFFKKLDNNASNDPGYMTIGFVNKSPNCQTSGPSNPTYYSAPFGEQNYFCSYQKFIDELKSDTSNSLAHYSNGFDFQATATTFSDSLKSFEEFLEEKSTVVADISEFQLEDTPDFSFSVVIDVVHADGSTITVPPEFYTIEGRILKIINPGFGQMVSLSDKLKVTYVQKTT